MSNALYRNSPLSWRKAKRPPHRFDPDELLERGLAEALDTLTGRLQELWTDRDHHHVVTSGPRSVEDFTMVAIVLLLVVDAQEQLNGRGPTGGAA